MKKLFFSPLLCLAIFSCNSNLNNLNEESFYGSWSSHVQYNESISTDIAFSVDSITDLIFLQEMTLIQYEIDENDQRMPSTDFVDRSTSDRDIIKQKVEELLEANNNIVGSWSSDPDEIYGFRSESGQNKMVVHETGGEFDYRLLDIELPQAGKKLQFYAPTGWTDFQDNKYLLIKSVRKNNRISMESEETKRYNFRMNTGLGATGPFDISGIKSKTLICNFEFRAL